MASAPLTGSAPYRILNRRRDAASQITHTPPRDIRHSMLAAAFYPTERISSHFLSNLQPQLEHRDIHDRLIQVAEKKSWFKKPNNP